MTTTHTPGPWKVREPSRQRGEHCHIEANGAWVAEAIYNGTTASAINANARLIAAAPEMVEALRVCADHLESIWREQGMPNSDGYYDDDCLGVARALLARLAP